MKAPRLRMKTFSILTVVLGLTAGAGWIVLGANPRPSATAAQVAATTVRPEARAQTAPTPHTGDAADDPAIWIHPQTPELSLILGTDKQGGLHSYNLDGSAVQLVSAGSHPNNVDVLYGFRSTPARWTWPWPGCGPPIAWA